MKNRSGSAMTAQPEAGRVRRPTEAERERAARGGERACGFFGGDLGVRLARSR